VTAEPVAPERVANERTFHDRWARSIDVAGLLVRESFEAETAIENRYALDSLGDLRGKRLLDLGCGAGESSVYFALRGARVVAVDVSGEMLAKAQLLARRFGTTIDTVELVSHELPFATGAFDLVFGNGVLHHVDLEPTLREVRRVLKPGGRGAFVEPLPYNPVIEVYRMLASEVRTPDERPVRFGELGPARRLFRRFEHREFWLASLVIFLYFFLVERASPSKVRYWKKVIEDAPRYAGIFSVLQRVDRFLLRAFPVLGYLCWNTVLVVEA
jgi:SAM-dependent methyltransferase